MSKEPTAENDAPVCESWAHKHARENPGHHAREGLDDPGSCHDCAERSPIYNLVTPPERQSEVQRLAAYNAERARGIMHTPEWDVRGGHPMNAGLLREAAALMRERAEAACTFTGEARWAFTHLGWNDVQGETYTVSDTFANVRVAEVSEENTADYIASWHPAVALAVADWLDGLADRWSHDATGSEMDAAERVACAYLGRDA
jgi:hypothetical protein